MRVSLALVSAGYASVCLAVPVLVTTTSGILSGTQSNGVSSFKGVRFAQPPTGQLRWEAPVPFISPALQTATTLGPSCLQQFPFASSQVDQLLFNNPPPPESEDCLFLNVWTPALNFTQKLPVLVWLYGGALDFGTASLPTYDGTSFATNQGVVVVSFNYRTNVFGFPGSPDLPLAGNNLGFLDQELALQWVQQNIARFGGDPKQVTIMGQSAGAQSASYAIQRHSPADAPFRAAIMLSGAQVTTLALTPFAAFNNFSVAVGCGIITGPVRLACLKQVSATVIRNFTNGPTGGTFAPVVDDVTLFADPLERIRTGLTARVPFIIGNTQNDGTAFAVGLTDLNAFLQTTGGGLITAAEVRPLYPGLNDTVIIQEIIKDVEFLCPAQLWSAAAVGAGVTNVYRYSYGPVFADLQIIPGLGAWHSSELPEIFGTFNPATATASEVTLSHTMQAIVANFVKNPTVAPAANWPKYIPGPLTTTLAKLAYNGNVATSNVVQTVKSDSIDGPCAFWDTILDPV
ncbi:Alpha/Beta hydrolase protein [Mycena alexandri]|uniref:Carboxylic ester hydrolase n=1 Tax=Mycena alexandri TaxID=1745969 RepID=A0AAD6S731_9AGAR|nr:Alpha/Beta hydrolase protein [Mycena alexandri]